MRIPRTPLVAGVSAATVLSFVLSAAGQPVTLSSPNREQGGLFGGAVASVPDLNNDGVQDIVVGAPDETVNGIEKAGRVYVYSGATGQLIRTLVSPTPQTLGRFGESVAGVPDVNADGRGDIAVGAPKESTLDTQFCGKAYVFSGANGALLTTLISPGRQTGGNFGFSIAGMDDANGDGRGNVAVGAPGEAPGGSPPSNGRVWIFKGQGGYWQRAIPPVQIQNGNFGYSIAAVPDANGDGRGDLIVGAPRVRHNLPGHSGLEPINVGRAYLISGATGRALRHFRSPAYTENGFFGISVSGLPDVNGDNRGDVVIGAIGDRPNNIGELIGRAYIYSGATGQYIRPLIPPYSEEGGEFGFAVAGIRDTTGDGRGDVLVSGWKQTWPGLPARSGVVHLYNGATGARVQSFLSPHAQLEGYAGATITGVAGPGGMSDVVVGAPAQTTGGVPDAGNVYIFRR